jgi:hypothetical protein
VEELHLTNPYLVLAAPPRSGDRAIRRGVGSAAHRNATHASGRFPLIECPVVLSELLTQTELSAAQRAGQIDSSVVVSSSSERCSGRQHNVNASYEARPSLDA